MGIKLKLGDVVELISKISYLKPHPRGVIMKRCNSRDGMKMNEILIPKKFWLSNINSRHKKNIILAWDNEIQKVY